MLSDVCRRDRFLFLLQFFLLVILKGEAQKADETAPKKTQDNKNKKNIIKLCKKTDNQCFNISGDKNDATNNAIL